MHKDHLIVVTGASSGIGRSLSIHLAKQNHKVIAIGRREQRMKELANVSKQIIPLVADITTAAGRQKIVYAVKQENQFIHLVHNAAIVGENLIKNLDESTLNSTFNTNLIAPALLTKDLTSYYKKSRMLNISSGLAHFPLLGTSVYCMSKAALFMFYKCVNLEFTPDILIAGSLDPGIVDTEMQQHLRNCPKEKLPIRDEFKQFKHDKQLISPDRVSQIISKMLFEASDEEFSHQEWQVEN